MPDTSLLRAVGVWYANYALAERVYNVGGIEDTHDARIARYFRAILPLRPGAETGFFELATERWRQSYGYDLFNVTGEVHSGGDPSGLLAVEVGRLDSTSIARALNATGYTSLRAGHDRLYVRSPLLNADDQDASMNVLVLGGHRLLTGVATKDVATALNLQKRSRTLGLNRDYRALASALGPIQAAFVAANVPQPPFALPAFPAPRRGHRGPPLHHFALYAVAYQEPYPGQRYIEIALAYTTADEALADVPVLYSRLQHETLPVYGSSWHGLISSATVDVRHGRILVARLRLRPTTPPTLWQDAVVEGDLSLLSQ